MPPLPPPPYSAVPEQLSCTYIKKIKLFIFYFLQLQYTYFMKAAFSCITIRLEGFLSAVS